MNNELDQVDVAPPGGYIFAFDSVAKCPECDRLFDLLNVSDAERWFSGHDCEAEW